MKTAEEVKKYEMEQYKKAFYIGTEEAWKNYSKNVKREVTKFNNIHEEQINFFALTAYNFN